jgi:Na+-translocating ferredoxin:NAD+ oxidoreductase RnfG subunit
MSTPGMSAKITITQAQAACLFYGKDVTAQNEVEARKGLTKSRSGTLFSEQ